MNRAEHIKKTLLKNIRNNIDYPNLEFVLLDYNSKDDLESWVKSNLNEYIKSGVLKYFQTREPKYFHVSKAKNMVHRFATGNIVCNLDADNYTGKDFAYLINYILNKKPKSVGSCMGYTYSDKFFDNFGIGGRIFLFKKYFDQIGGYDESFVGWNYEDSDFVTKAKKLGLHEYIIPLCYLRTIKHSHKMRLENYDPEIARKSPLLG
jgi:predicted glycosyltransferase involved in capsule biosynthesis